MNILAKFRVGEPVIDPNGMWGHVKRYGRIGAQTCVIVMLESGDEAGFFPEELNLVGEENECD